MNQALFLKDFVDTRPKFNDNIMIRDDDEIVREVMNVVYSCQRSKFFTIRVNRHYVLEDPFEINEKLKEHENLRRKNLSEEENIYNYMIINDSCIKLLVVEYYACIKGKSDTFEVLIMVPRLYNKFYYKIMGNLYLASYQITEASTYNNTNSSNKKKNVTLKTIFTPDKIYRKIYKMTTTKGEQLEAVHYEGRIFNKTVPAFKFLFAKFGLYGAFKYSNINVITIEQKDPNNDNFYTFEKFGIFISVPKIMFDNDYTVQSMVYTLFRTISKNIPYGEYFKHNFWISSLGGDYNKFTVEKGLRVLESFEGIYDRATRNNTKLPFEKKKNIYTMTLWIMREFSNLMIKDNSDVSCKRYVLGEYIASLYAMKLYKGIIRISDFGNKADMSTLKKAIVTQSDYLLKAITKCVLVNYNNAVNDMDGLYGTKFSLKVLSSNDKGNNISDEQRRTDPSHMGIIDMESSGNSEPGTSGMLCPISTFKDSYFDDKYKEPDTWEEGYIGLLNEYKKSVGLLETVQFKKDLLNKGSDDEIEALMEEINCFKGLIKPVTLCASGSGYLKQAVTFITEGVEDDGYEAGELSLFPFLEGTI